MKKRGGKEEKIKYFSPYTDAQKSTNIVMKS